MPILEGSNIDNVFSHIIVITAVYGSPALAACPCCPLFIMHYLLSASITTHPLHFMECNWCC
ncbi:hypothetical protein K439DRAFT_1635988 [Ramaria rubella]|nr:hypothetical protein K439DRAFT_1635988 [Ramaria rubella]